MCRLIGLRAAGPVPLFRYLLAGDNSFAVQSLEHPDGWGLAYYEELGDGARELTVLKSVLPAICDEAFEQASFAVEAPTVLAHIRRATAGRVARQNCHPFRRGEWVFAHNGHVHGIERLRPALLERIAPDLREPLESQTDSELYFLLFLTALRERVALEDPAPPPAAVAAALDSAVRAIRALSPPPTEGEPTTLTCLASNGELLFGYHGGKPLSLRAQGDADPLVMFSSEAVAAKGFEADGPPWAPLGEGELAVVDRRLGVERLDLAR